MRLLLTLTLCSMLLSCGEAERFFAVDLSTDYVAGVDFTSVRISLQEAEAPTSQDLVHAAESRDYVRPSRIATFDDVEPGTYSARVQLLADNGAIVGQRLFQFQMTESYILPARIDRDCANVSCPGDGDSPLATECLGGECVPPTCTTPADCGVMNCEEDDECAVSPVACRDAACVGGLCGFAERAGACGSDEYCDLSLGCQTRPDVPDQDAGSDAGDVGTDVSDAGTDPADVTRDVAEECGMPCDYEGAACEAGVFDCASGTPVCVSAGAQPEGTTCRAPSGDCDAPDVCDGTSLDCPDMKLESGTVCRPASGECDVPETCDGVATACPADAFVEVGMSCGAGFCDGAGTCNDTCIPGAACSPAGAPCRTGTLDCSTATPTCVASGNVPNGTMCGETTAGAWGACGGYSGTCDTSGTESRTVVQRQCQAGSCEEVSSPESRACSRSTSGVMCGSDTTTSWSACNYSGVCDNNATRTRDRTSFTCQSAVCTPSTTQESQACNRNQNGVSCGTTQTGSWSACSYSSACAQSGSRTRSVTTYSCGSGSCQTNTTTQTDTSGCARSTNGTTCSATQYGSWSACGGFTGTCDNTGTRSRSVTTYTCGGGSCNSSVTSEGGSCSRNTDSTPCYRACRYGSCSSGSCSVASPCNSPNRCCEPNICVSSTQNCP